MTISIASNIASLGPQRKLGESTDRLATIYERLSSGQRINSASDDAAGLAVAESLRMDTRVYQQALRNVNDGVSAINIADTALSTLGNIVVHLQELAEQSASGAMGYSQRKSINAEAQALSDEFTRISQSAQFNGMSLLDGSVQELALQAGYSAESVLTTGFGGAMGTGTFSASSSYVTGASLVRSMAYGDLNGDGVMDMVATTNSSGAIVRMGVGDGSFGSATTYAAESNGSYGVALGDVNGDGTLDLLTTGMSGAGGPGSVTVRMGAGDGSFGAVTSFSSVTGACTSIVLDDFNQDGILDLATAGFTGGLSGQWGVHLGNGDGSFRRTLGSGLKINWAVTSGDINGDGIADLITAGYDSTNAGAVSVRLGAGDGTFGSETDYKTETTASYAVKLGDLNGDGKLDLLTAGSNGADGYSTVRLGNGDGSFGVAVSYLTDSNSSNGLALSDLNGDAILDMVTVGSSGCATVNIGKGDGTFAAGYSFAAESQSVAVADLNGDGVLDLGTAGNSRSTVKMGVTKDGVSPLLEFDLSSMAGARQALPIFERKLDQLSSQQGQIGAFQSRLSSVLNVVSITRENYSAAGAQILDADVAQEAANMLREQVLQQACTSILAQANQQPGIALKLLQSDNGST